jgi:hypothetical protein
MHSYTSFINKQIVMVWLRIIRGYPTVIGKERKKKLKRFIINYRKLAVQIIPLLQDTRNWPV